MSAERRRGFLFGLLAGAAVALALAALADAVFSPFGGSGTVSNARTTIEDNYFHSVGGDELDNASIDGMVSELRHRYHDRFSRYLDPHSVGQFESETSGQFSGIGLNVTGAPRGLRVASAIPNTPAQRAGLRRGDLIVAANGHSLAERSRDAAVSLIRGTPGTSVSLRVVQAGGAPARTIRVKRADVRVPAVKGTIRRADGSKVAYVRFATFSAGAHGELRAAVDRLYRRGAQGLVLDLRGNGGGLLDEAVLSSSVFLHKGQRVVSTKSRTEGDTNYDAVGDPVARKPIVVLVDHDTASAAEILTAALAEHHLATVVGIRTFGKGTFQQALDLPNGGALDLTIGRFFTANGSSTLNKGIEPDVRAADNAKTKADEALRRGLSVLGGKLGGGR
jgi:carboxyl-terminal processing protease